MKTKQFLLTAFAVIALVTATFSNIFSNDETELRLYDETTFKSADSTGNGDGNPGGPVIPPTGH